MHDHGFEQRLVTVLLPSQRLRPQSGKNLTRQLPRVHGQVLHHQCTLFVLSRLGDNQAVFGRGDGQQDPVYVHRPQGGVVSPNPSRESSYGIWWSLQL